MVEANGFPKSGNHALARALESLGWPAGVAHIPFSAGWPDGVTHLVYIKRDPRNVVLSALRAEGNAPSPGLFLSFVRNFRTRYVGGESLINAMARYEGWLTDAKALVVRFEDLIAGDAELRRIADYLGAPYHAGAYEAFMSPPGLTLTWTGALSDYRTLWTADVAREWEREGGNELLERWGYATS